MRGIRETIRAYKTAREAAQITAMYRDQPWVRDYRILRHGRRWQAVHLRSGGVLGPARTLAGLGWVILADVQSRPLVPGGRR